MGFVFLFSNLAQDASQLKSVWMENVWINAKKFSVLLRRDVKMESAFLFLSLVWSYAK